MPISPLLQRFVDDELGLARPLIGRVLAGTLQLLGFNDSSLGASERAQYADAVKALQRSASRYEEGFVENLRRIVADELDDIGDPSAPDIGTGLGGLQLMDESRVEIDIELSRAMQLIDTTAEWELRELQMFTSTLTGQRHVTSDSNPLRPLVYAKALWEAASVATPTQAQRALILRTSAGVAAGLLKNAWAAAATRLESQGVEPGTYRTVILPSGSAMPNRIPTPEPTRANPLSALLASMPGASFAPSQVSSVLGSLRDDLPPPRSHAGGQNLDLEHALLRLDELLRQLPHGTAAGGGLNPALLEQQRNSLVASASDTQERQVIELVTRLFQAMQNDSLLAIPFRPVVVRMQVAVLRVMLGEAGSLDSYEHPAWRLIDRISEVGNGYSRPEDPRLAAFQSFVTAVAEEMAGAAVPDTTLFRRGLNRVDIFLSEQLQAQLRNAQSSVETLQLAERREVLQQYLAQRLTEQMATLRTSPTIRRFVTGTWAQVIAENMLRHGDQSEPTLGALKTVDDLLWSLKIPDHPQSRQRLVTLLPTLLQRVRGGLELVNVAPPEQQAVLDELMTIHTEALRAGGRSGTGALTPEEIVQRMRDEVLPGTP
ncbi:MAG: DUF1631 domain-containing protein, partial [Pseudomonadota bacterium]|nr:DUF1631 domain-containing protein [Pseudomonadota bacterium]